MLDAAGRLFDPVALLLVFGGTSLAACAQATREDLARAIAALRPALRARPARDAEIAERTVRSIQLFSEYKGVVGADRVRCPIGFVQNAARRLADAEGSDAFAAWAEDQLDARRARHEAAAAVWRSAAEIAPAMGMIGTVVGLIFMFGRMSEPDAMGPAMATAMLTTLYGLVIAAGITGPVANRLDRLSREERRWQERVVARLVALARAEEETARPWRGLSRIGVAS